MQDQQPNQESSPPPKQEEIRIRGVRISHKHALLNISIRKGVSLSDLIKLHLDQIINSYPEHFRQPLPKE